MTADPVRAMFVVPSAKRVGGGDVWIEALLTEIGQQGIEPMVVFEEHGELAEHASRHGCTTAVLGVTVGSQPGELKQLSAPLARLIAAYRPQATIFWSPRAQLYGAAAHREAGRPGRTAWVQHVMPSQFWMHRAASEAPSDLVICVSRAVQERQRQLYTACQTTVIHPGLGAPLRPKSRAEGRKALGYNGDVSLVGVVGRIEPWKGQDITVRMLAELPAGTCSLVLIGERRSAIWPEFADQVEALAQNLSVTAQVTFVGHLREAAAYLPGLDVLVCASREEGFGLAILEAMASGIPVIATRCGGPEDMIEHEVNGLLIAPEDPAAMANAVRRLLSDPAVAGRLSDRAMALHREQFTSAAAAARFAAVITRLASGSPA